ncbi:unnamed protein product, partial [Symbiodinium sp. CCMP2456]
YCFKSKFHLIAMALSGMTFTAPVGVSSKENIPNDVGLVEEQGLSNSKQNAYVILVGKGIASHWASVWIFEDGDVFVVELTAIDTQTGFRWIGSRCKMRYLRMPLITRQVGHRDLWAWVERKPDRQQQFPPQTFVSNLQDELRGTFFNQGQSLHQPSVRLLFEPKRLHDLVALISFRNEEDSKEVKELVHSFIYDDGCGHYIMNQGGGILRIQDISPYELCIRAKNVPLHGSFYDLLFHNCQLFLVQLLCDECRVPVEELPVTVGSVAAGPLLLLLELVFLGLYYVLHRWSPLSAACAALPWIAAEMYCTSRYRGCSCHQFDDDSLTCSPGFLRQAATFIEQGPVAGIVGTLAICGAVLLGQPIPSSLPVLSLWWDICLVHESMLVNKVYRNQRLTLLNVSVVLAVLSLVGFLQWLSGWPVQEAFLVLAAVICAVICGFACGDVVSSASEYHEARQGENEAQNVWSIYPPSQDGED